MQLGMIGLARMGANRVRRRMRSGLLALRFECGGCEANP